MDSYLHVPGACLTCDALRKGDAKMAEIEMPEQRIIVKAKLIAFEYIKKRLEKTDTHVTFAFDEVYVVWFSKTCLLYTSDAADDLLCVDLGGRRIIKKKKTTR